MLVKVYGDNAPSDKTCREWFWRFKNGDFDVEDKERSERPRAFEDEELQALIKTHVKHKNNFQKH